MTVDSGADAGYPKTIEEEYYISELPEGFERVDYSKRDISVSSTYFNNDKYVFFIQYTKEYYEENYDNERASFGEYTNIQGQDYILSIRSNLNKNIILELCKSTKSN